MSRAVVNQAPSTLGLLSDSAAAAMLSSAVRSGQERPPQAAIAKAASVLPEAEARWHTRPIIELLDEAAERFDGARAKADAWLAPRLHATLRMTRAEAADSRRWNYLALAVGSEYVVWRHRGTDSVAAGRFCGPHYTQAFSRLWWAAELFRNGSDYRPVETACMVQDMLNTVLRLDVIDHRPTAIAVVRLLARLMADETAHLGDHVNALSSAVNSAGSTLMYDVLTAEHVVDHIALREWVAEADTMPPVSLERLPHGPDDGTVTATMIDSLTSLFERLLSDAPLRRRARHSASDEDAQI